MKSVLEVLRVRNGAKRDSEDVVVDGVFTPAQRVVVLREYPRLIKERPNIVCEAWVRSANCSQSIKMAFKIPAEIPPEEDELFMALVPHITRFFDRLVVDLRLEEPAISEACEALGARHIDYHERGFTSTFWDVFMVCIIEVIHEGLETFADDPAMSEIRSAFDRFIQYMIYHMRLGYNERRKAEIQKSRSSDDPPSSIHD